MTKKDYEAFASAIYRASKEHDTFSLGTVIDLCAGVFQTDNGMFQRGKFVEACTEGAHIRKTIKERF